ncbi:MAG: CAP domain-containing protein [Candidatus Paceibacterota bacterium]
MKQSVLTFLIVALFFAPQSAVAASREELLAHIQKLQRIVLELTEELHEKIFNENRNFRFERNLSIGSRGDDVTRLQTFLSKNTQFYPEGLVTGYYGEMTDRAIGRLKNEYQIIESNFGEETRKTLNQLFQEKSTFVVSTSGFTLSPVQLEESSRSAREIEGVKDIQTSAIARDIHIAINRIRVKNNLNALDWDDDLAGVALFHSLDQSRDNKELTSPDLLCQYPIIRHEGFESGFGVRDRVISALIDFRSVGENIAMIPGVKSRSYTFEFDEPTPECPPRDVHEINSFRDRENYKKTLEALLASAQEVRDVTFVRTIPYTQGEIVDLALNGWMNSSGHRENILYEDYTHGGVGVVKVNEYYIITHNFVGRE